MPIHAVKERPGSTVLHGRGAAVLYLLLTLAFGSAGCSRHWPGRHVAREHTRPTQTPPQPKAGESPAIGSVAVERGRIYANDDQGHIIWQASADHIRFSEERRDAILDRASCTLFENGKPVTNLAARRLVATVEGNDRKLQFSGGVTAESLVSHVKLWLDSAVWLWNARRLVSAKQVELQKGNVRLHGDRLEADTALRRVRVIGSPASLQAVPNS